MFTFRRTSGCVCCHRSASLRVRAYEGDRTTRQSRLVDLGPNDVVIVSYALITRDNLRAEQIQNLSVVSRSSLELLRITDDPIRLVHNREGVIISLTIAEFSPMMRLKIAQTSLGERMPISTASSKSPTR